MAVTQKRDKPLKIMMTAPMHARLVQVAEMLGQPPATLASLAVSEMVNRYTAVAVVQDKAIAAMVNHFGPDFERQMKLMEEQK